MVSYMAAAHSMAVFVLVLVLIQLLVVFVDDISIMHSIRGGSFVSIVEPIIHNGLLVCGLDLQHMKSIDVAAPPSSRWSFSSCIVRGRVGFTVTYGIFFCLECSGIHRSLGVHIRYTRARSCGAGVSADRLSPSLSLALG